MPSVYEYSREWSVSRLKKEYSRLRAQFDKQIKRLSKFDQSPKIQAYLPGGYKNPRTIKDIESLRGRKDWSEKAIREDWAVRVAELKGLTKARSLSLSGKKAIRKDIIKSLQKDGYTSINNKNFDKFTSFMNFAKSTGVIEEFGSKETAEAFDTYLKGGIIENPDLAQIIQEWESTVESYDLFD